MSSSIPGLDWRRTTVLMAALATLAGVGALGGEFVFDDRPFLVDNNHLDQPHSLAWFFRENVWHYSNLEDAFSSSYRPLFFLTLWVLNAVGLGGPFALHCFSLVLHVLASVLVLVLIRRLVPDVAPAAAAVGAAVFAVHPAHSEAVAWIAAFPHTLSAVFLLCASLLYLRGRGDRSRWRNIAAVVIFGMALLTNEIAAAFPLFLLAYEWLHKSRSGIWRSLPFFAVLALYALLRRTVLGESLPLDLLDAGGWARLPVFAAQYLGQLLVPWPQPLFLEMPDTFHISAGAWLGLALLAALAAFAARTSPRPASAAVAWILTFMAPPLAAAFNPDALFALRSLYVPSIGLALLVATVTSALPSSPPRGAGVLVGGILLAGLLLTNLANRQWDNDGRVYARVIEWNPQGHAGYLGLGGYLERQGQFESAIDQYREAVERADAASAPAAMEVLGRAQSLAGNHAESIDTFRILQRIDPQNAEAWIGIGNNRWALSDLAGAAAAYQKAYEIEPANVAACHNLQLVLRQLGRNQEAARYAHCAADPER
jgi:tetratricopeptide (TPR) repeat protein